MAEASSMELLRQWRDREDQGAAQELFQRYVVRLVALAQARMNPMLARRVDAEDVVQSAWRSFFVRVRDGRLLVQPGTELWDLLAAITMRKVLGQAEHHGAQKRSFKREQELADNSSVCWLEIEAVARGPGAEEQAAIAEELEKAMQSLLPLHREIVQLRLQECTATEIAAKVGRTDRMVRLVLAEFGKKLAKRLAEFDAF